MATKTQMSMPFTLGTSFNYIDEIPYHTHSHYEIYYFRSGKANYIINDKIYVLEPNDLLLMHGMTLHKAYMDPSVAYHRTTLHFDPYYFKQHIQPSYAEDLLAPFQKLQNVRIPLGGKAKDEIEDALDKMEELLNSGTPSGFQRFQARFADLLIQINELCKAPMNSIVAFPTSKEKHVQAIISYVESNFREDITLEAIQNELHLNKYYLAKTFKEVTGMTIFQFLMHRRIYQAKLELIGEERSITEICYDVGFKHPSHFSRSFKEHTAITPEQYRKKHHLH
ncbi:helix-turn-helix domain-containing protein [Paenibacillus sp. HB172176]|uniref:helix-turn-helix transcriptional regulator n=1 Tax=Paenibacillus sp. HB172176 TaxID=2493690 RepID=UPI00143B0908|nr:helix-turn-helix domain-containing protein [Paenibacillus sp. HB172176]